MVEVGTRNRSGVRRVKKIFLPLMLMTSRMMSFDYRVVYRVERGTASKSVLLRS
jgi:hypothetical protein